MEENKNTANERKRKREREFAAQAAGVGEQLNTGMLKK